MKNIIFILTMALLLPAAELEHECTSWLVFHDLTGNNTNLLHKNRDSKSRDITLLLGQEQGKHKWVGMGYARPGERSGSPCMGMNEKGLACVMNSGEKCTDNSNLPKNTGKGTPAILMEVLEKCSNVRQALETLKGIVDRNEYNHGDSGSIFFFMDRDEAYIVEMTAHFISPMRYDHGYAFRANIWHNPGMAAYADNTPNSFLGSANREYMVLTALNQAIRNHGKITVQDVLALSRNCKLENSPVKRTVCSKTTNSASTLEIDREFPAVLSTAYLLIGPPRHTLCIPVPMVVTKEHPAMLSQAWVKSAWKSFDAKGETAEIPGEWLAFEKESLEKYKAAQAKAREYIRAGKQPEAESLLLKTTQEIWDSAACLMKLK